MKVVHNLFKSSTILFINVWPIFDRHKALAEKVHINKQEKAKNATKKNRDGLLYTLRLLVDKK